jgi:hypothetical protein
MQISGMPCPKCARLMPVYRTAVQTVALCLTCLPVIVFVISTQPEAEAELVHA